jgi:two-component system, OmpR family, sensor histidine kinase ArlS
MKLQSKLALFNAASKAIIILVFILLMPLVINHVALLNTDRQLEEKKEQVLELIEHWDITAFIEEGSESGYGSYNLLKEEFISLELIPAQEATEGIENSQRRVDDDIVNYRVLSHTFQLHGEYYLLEIGRSLSTIQDIAATLRRFALFVLLAIVLLTVASDIAFTKYLLRPLGLINKKLRKTHDPAAFQVEKIHTTTDEFTYLDESLHDMMSRIEAAFLKEREFIANVSHELLTPISILQSKLENMLVSEETSEENSLRLVESLKTLSRLKNITRALLLISKIENEQYLKTDSTSIGELVEEVTEEIEDRLQLKNIRLQTEIETDYPLPHCNKSLLHNMLFNLVNNAIKYNQEGGSIVLKGYASPEGYVLEVNDTGIGIDENNLPHIFSRFKRFHKNDKESFGLGLPIVKTIADFHQINIGVASTPQQGSSFTLTFG